MTISRIGWSPTGTSGFGIAMVNGCRRVPRPPASMTARLMGAYRFAGSGRMVSHRLLPRPASACTALASRLQKDQVSGPAICNTPRKPVTSQPAASEGSASGRDRKAWLASCCAFAVALVLLGAMLCTLFEKNLVSTVTQQGWTRELYGISAAVTKMRFGIGGFAIDRRIIA